MQRLLVFLIVMCVVISSCKKEVNVEDQAPDTSDTVTLFTVIFPDADADSITKTVMKISSDGTTKYIVTETWANFPGKDITIFYVNSKNQLTSKENFSDDEPAYHEKTIFTYEGDHVVKSYFEDSDGHKSEIVYSYQKEGNNIRITETGDRSYGYGGADTTYDNNGQITYYTSNLWSYLVTPDLKPISWRVIVSRFTKNDPEYPASVGSDTIVANYMISNQGDLEKIVETSVSYDTAYDRWTGYTYNFRESNVVYEYKRDQNAGNDLADIVNNIGGKWQACFRVFDGDDEAILPGFADKNFLSNRPLKELTMTQSGYRNGEPDPENGTATIIKGYKNIYDAEGRLIQCNQTMSSGIPMGDEYRFRIVWH